MSLGESEDNGRNVKGRQFSLSDQAVTWAGEAPLMGGFCYGTERGEIWFAEIDEILSGPKAVVKSGEAVNGAAFNSSPSHQLMAVSTRNEIKTFRSKDFMTESVESFTYEGGAHGVIPTLRGGFLAPLGPWGLLTVTQQPDSETLYREIRTDAEVNYYKVRSLGDSGLGEHFVSASRQFGLSRFHIDSEGNAGLIRTFDLKGRDVIDVCSLRSPEWPHAIAVLDIDGTIHFNRNIGENHGLTSMHFPPIDGVAYSIESSQGHIFVLTSRGFYTFENLATRFLSGDSLEGPTSCSFSAADPVSFSIAYDKYLLLVVPDAVWQVEVRDLVAETENRVVTTASERNGGFPSSILPPQTPEINIHEWNEGSHNTEMVPVQSHII